MEYICEVCGGKVSYSEKDTPKIEICQTCQQPLPNIPFEITPVYKCAECGKLYGTYMAQYDTDYVPYANLKEWRYISNEEQEARRLLKEVQIATANKDIYWSGAQDLLLEIIAFIHS